MRIRGTFSTVAVLCVCLTSTGPFPAGTPAASSLPSFVLTPQQKEMLICSAVLERAGWRMDAFGVPSEHFRRMEDELIASIAVSGQVEDLRPETLKRWMEASGERYVSAIPAYLNLDALFCADRYMQ